MFGYEKVLKKEDLGSGKRAKGKRANNWKQTLYRIWLLVDEQRGLLITVLLMVVLSSVAALAGPFLVGKIIDDYIVAGQFEGIGFMIIVLIGIYIVLSASTFLQNYWMIGIAQTTIYKMRTNVFTKLMALPVTYFDKRQHGELMSRATNDVEAVSATLNSSFIQVFSSILTLAGTLIVMIYLSPLLTVLTMLIIPVMFWAMRWITRRTSKLYKEQQAAVGTLNGMVEETISGQRIVKAFSQEERLIQEFEERNRRMRTVGFWALSYAGYIPKVMNALNNASFAIVAGVGGLLAFNGYITIGTIVIFTEYARQFTRPLNDLANQFNTVLSALAGAERVFAVMDEPVDEDEGLTDVKIRGDVAFERVSFKYDTQAAANILHDIEFTVRAGQTLALVGPTGAGKTTIMQLIARFYDTTEGKVTVDGIDVKEFSREALRSQMAFVLQDPFLFETTVLENIRYGKLTATNEEIIEAAKKANAHTFIEQLPHGYETVLSADGSGISQGQKQLLSIARALVADPAILLLDEATSSIDTVTEMEIQQALEILMRGRTSFVIAHRLNTVKNADMVLVLQQGCIVEYGPQQQLIAQDGIYANMLREGKDMDEWLD